MRSVDYRICCLRIYNYLGSMRKAAKIMNVGVASISRWSKRIDVAKWPSRGSKIVDAVEAVIKIVLDREPYTTARQLQHRIKADFRLDVSRQLLSLGADGKRRLMCVTNHRSPAAAATSMNAPALSSNDGMLIGSCNMPTHF